jgi:hydrogenase maturation protease
VSGGERALSSADQQAELARARHRGEPQILVAGVGNAWMKDDAFGGHVIKRLEAHDLPAGVSVMDFGTGGLDLAYEVMRGYDALILVDASRQGGEPGTLYVMEPDPAEIEAIEDGEMLNPHGMDPGSVLRFVRSVGGWPGKVLVVACEPADVDDMGLELSPAVEAAAQRAVALVLETVDEMRAETARGAAAASEDA